MSWSWTHSAVFLIVKRLSLHFILPFFTSLSPFPSPSSFFLLPPFSFLLSLFSLPSPLSLLPPPSSLFPHHFFLSPFSFLLSPCLFFSFLFSVFSTCSRCLRQVRKCGCFNRGNMISSERDDRLRTLEVSAVASGGKFEKYCTVEKEQDRSSRGTAERQRSRVGSKGQ